MVQWQSVYFFSKEIVFFINDDDWKDHVQYDDYERVNKGKDFLLAELKIKQAHEATVEGKDLRKIASEGKYVECFEFIKRGELKLEALKVE